jgi:hypothetical protein
MEFLAKSERFCPPPAAHASSNSAFSLDTFRVSDATSSPDETSNISRRAAD